MSIVKIEGNHFNALLANVPKNDARYYLCGILMDHAERVMVATDGHAMTWVPFETTDELSEDIIWSVTKPVAKSVDHVEIWIEPNPGEDTLRYNQRGELHRIGLSRVDGKFPDWKRVRGEGLNGVEIDTVSFNPNLVNRTAKALGVVGVSLSFTKDLGPIKVEYSKEPDVHSVVMPMRV